MKKALTIVLLALFALSISAYVLLWNQANTSIEKEIDKGYLAEVLANLQEIKSATYTSKLEGYAPGDTMAFTIYNTYIEEYNNPIDTTIGASFVQFDQKDKKSMGYCYDGNMKASVNRKRNYFSIDSFQVTTTPFRPMNSPFFNYTKSIIKYALETSDSTTIVLKDLGDTVHLSLTIHEDKQIEFFGKACYVDNPYFGDDQTSRYEMWITKSNNLPFRVKRELSQGTSITTCSDVEFNKLDIKNFVASTYFPSDIPLTKKRPAPKHELEGKVAPDWMLKNSDNESISLTQLNSKVLMIQFTSVNCGPCRMSVPFLNKLVTDYSSKDFDFVSIEGFTRNSMVLKKYQDRSEINYKFLMSTDDVTKNYQIGPIPVFFILDQHRVVRKVIQGYGNGSTDKEIREVINQLI